MPKSINPLDVVYDVAIISPLDKAEKLSKQIGTNLFIKEKIPRKYILLKFVVLTIRLYL